MPRGGARPGAGRPKRSGNRTGTTGKAIPSGTPLEYMLAVMTDPAAGADRRDRMAIAAAPYLHLRMSDLRASKKAERKEAATEAAAKFAVPPGPKLIVDNG